MRGVQQNGWGTDTTTLSLSHFLEIQTTGQLKRILESYASTRAKLSE